MFTSNRFRTEDDSLVARLYLKCLRGDKSTIYPCLHKLLDMMSPVVTERLKIKPKETEVKVLVKPYYDLKLGSRFNQLCMTKCKI